MLNRRKSSKRGKSGEVIGTLKPHVEPSSVPKEQAPLRVCYRYMVNRKGQFDYKEAIADDLPIGSGAIESAHRYIIQDRLKLPGAWWTDEDAHNMLALRTLRANNAWESYWDRLNHQAAMN